VVPTRETSAGGEPREVKITELENEITQLGRSVAKEAGNAEAVTRAASLTLVVYVETAEAGREVSELVSAVAQQNPCRAIILVARQAAKPDGLRAWISVHSNRSPSGGKQLCYEQISLDARGGAVSDLGSVVLPLTVSGLPVYLWWRASRYDPPDYFNQVLRLTSHVLVDSARFRDPESDLIALARHVEKKSARVSFLDLNWARITPWRELIAQCFDQPEARAYLERLQRVTIEFESESPRLAAQGAQALLIAGWLAGRLEWQPGGRRALVQNGTTKFNLRSARGEVEIQRVARRFEGGGKGVCFSITLEAGGDPPATFHLERGCDGRSVATRRQIAGRPPISRIVRLEVLEEAELVNEELQISSRDRVFEESLAMVARCFET
jgi:glucose-6-phosphate dehydrogenase assembly protein OpcA